MLTSLGKIAFLFAIVHLTLCLHDVTKRTQKMFLEPLSPTLIDHINKINTTWKAGVNFHEGNDAVIFQLVGMLPHRLSVDIPKLDVFVHDVESLWGKYGAVPDSFDARDKWPSCVTIGRVQDQGACKAGYAIAAAEAMTDRFCTLSKTKNTSTYVNISTEDIISCCGVACGAGCNGGFATAVWHYWVKSGIVTGGMYNSSANCRPYTIKSCFHTLPNVSSSSGFEPTTAIPLPDICAKEAPTPVCIHQCQKEYAIPYTEDLHFGKSAYGILPNVSQIQAEILNYGPVQADMDVYADFFSYKSGVYQHESGGVIGQHSVKLIGWGTENKSDYWLAVNSWNTYWGDKGLFKILRGKNECGIESNIVAGTPQT